MERFLQNQAGPPAGQRRAFRWGLSPTLPKDIRVEQIDLRIDSAAYTVLTRYDGDPKEVEHLNTMSPTWRLHPLETPISRSRGRRRQGYPLGLAFDQKSVDGHRDKQQYPACSQRRLWEFTATSTGTRGDLRE